MQTGIDYFSTATDYVRGASNFFLNVFDLGATTYQTVRDRVKNFNDPKAIVEPQKENFFDSFFKDREKVLTFAAVALVAAGIIYTSRR